MIVICGLPNAGKTTYSAQFENVLHYDDILKHSRAERERIYQETNAECIEGIYNTAKSRRILLEAINDKPGERVCIWIDTPADECIRRENRGRHPSVVEHHARIFEPPTYGEGWDEIIVIKGEKDGEVITSGAGGSPD